ncbi:MAG: hypothetical protein WC570_00085 [Patescibacteria group bacterium]
MPSIQKKSLQLISTLGLLISSLPQKVFARDYIKDFTSGLDINYDGNLFEMLAPILLRIIGFALSLAGFVAIGFIIYSGYLLVTAQGNEQQVEQGKKSLVNAIIGFIIALSGVVIISTIQTWIGVGQ